MAQDITMIGIRQDVIFCHRSVRTIIDTSGVRWFVVADFQDIFVTTDIFEVIGQELDGDYNSEKTIWFFPEKRVCINSKGLQHLQQLVEIQV